MYEPPSDQDGFRVLVDRLWPRGLSKKSAHVDTWLREIAPSQNLRKWFSHDPKRWAEFKKKYQIELDKNKDTVSDLKSLEKEKKKITLLYAAKDTDHNNAVVLQDWIK